MNTYSLSKYPSSFYLNQFDESQIEQAAITIKDEWDSFEIYFETQNGKVKPNHIDLAKALLAEVVELDKMARDIAGEGDDECLAYITICSDEISFCYFSTTCNSEWETHFVKSQNNKWSITKCGTRDLRR